MIDLKLRNGKYGLFIHFIPPIPAITYSQGCPRGYRNFSFLLFSIDLERDFSKSRHLTLVICNLHIRFSWPIYI